MSEHANSASVEVLDHPSLGRIIGCRRSKDVVQYLGVQYATLRDCFSRGELVKHFGNHEVDATKHGPIVLNPANGYESEQALIQKSLPFNQLKHSGTECLTLNISVPRTADESAALPVLVFVHGGGYNIGSSSYPHYDLKLVTEMSLNHGLPMIAIGVNYRVGVPGFLTSVEMKAAGYKANNGLNDQHLALRWIKDNIKEFGGDPNRVTFLGESAGSASGCYQLHLEDPLFQQYISMSGTSILRPRRIELVENAYKLLTEDLGVAKSPVQAKIQALLNAASGDFLVKFARKYPAGLVVDGDVVPGVTTYKSLIGLEELLKQFPGVQHCKKILVGDCQMDGMIWQSRLKDRTDIFPRTLAKCLREILDPIDKTLAARLIDKYGLDLSATSNTFATTLPVLNLGNDVTFAQPASCLAHAWSRLPVDGSKAFQYHFNCPNPWDGPWKGHSSHALDIAFALQNYREHLCPGQQQCAERFAIDIIKFVNGLDPWDPYEQTSSTSMLYFAGAEGDKDESNLVDGRSPEITGRRCILQEIGTNEVIDKVMDAWQLFMAGPQ